MTPDDPTFCHRPVGQVAATVTQAPPRVVLCVSHLGVSLDLSWLTKHGEVTIYSEHPLTITPLAENAVRVGRR